jgi:cytoskeleton protein RodZ
MESFGARLRRERERLGITLDEITSSTKIGTRMLRALEEEHFEQLPGGIFNKGFVRAYARHLGLDEDQAVADYLTASGEAQPPKTPEDLQPIQLAEVRGEAESGGIARIPWGVFAVALLIVALGFALWGFYSRATGKHVATAATAPGSATHASAQEPDAASSRVPSTATEPAQLPPAAAPALSVDERPANQQSVNQPSAIPAAGGTLTPTADQSHTSVASSGAFLVLIKAREDSWISITADGKQIMHDTLIAPAEKSVEAQKEIVIRAGNVGALDFVFNGHRLPSQGDYGEVRAITFDANGLRPQVPKNDSPEAMPR